MLNARTTHQSIRTAMLVLALASAASSTALAASSSRSTRSHMSVDGNLVDVTVRVDGSNAPLFFRPGTWDRHYFQAFKGRNYSLMLHNNTNRRVGVLIAVDGLNVVNGVRTGLERNEPMYVLDPYEDATISGWRTSLNDVRRFVFVDEERSYAERTGQTNGDLGWIRVVSFKEVERIAWWNVRGNRGNEYGDRKDGSGVDRRESANDAPQAAAPESRTRDNVAEGRTQGLLEKESARKSLESNPGTGWGQHQNDPVSQTQFEPVAHATDQIALRYEYASGLNALGIFPARFRTWERENGNLGFAQPPRW